MKKILLLLLLCLPILSFSQHTLTDDEMIRIDSLFQVYEQNDTKLFIEIIQACAVYFAWAEAVYKRVGVLNDKGND